MVERADVISKDFARQFKEKLADKQKKNAASRLPLVAQADLAYLFKLATGDNQIQASPVRQKEALTRLKEVVRRYVQV